MLHREVNRRSPLKIFERSLYGGLGKGNIGVVISRAGVGKSMFLVGIALDDLIHGRSVMHVSLGDSVEHVRSFYDEIYNELFRSSAILDADHVRSSIEQNRHIHSYTRENFRLGSLYDAALSLRDHANFAMDTLIIDNFPFEDAEEKHMEMIRRMANELDVEVWVSALSHRDAADTGEDLHDPVRTFDDYLSVKLYLEPVANSVRLRLLKDHENTDPDPLMIELDPRNLLLKDTC